MPEITDGSFIVPPQTEGVFMGAADQGDGARAAVWETANFQKAREPVTLESAGALPLSAAFNLVVLNVSTGSTFTVPPQGTVAWPPGTIIELYRANATNEIAIAGGAGVTVHSRGNQFRLNAQRSVAQLRRIAPDVWVLSGDLKV